MMNIYWHEWFLRVIHGDIGDTREGGVGVEELGKKLTFAIVIGIEESCSST